MMNPNKGNSTLNTLWTMMDNAISRVFTAMPVQVLSVDTDKRILDVMPMLSMLDNEGQAVDHAQISNIPYVRQQAGDYGIILDPKIGDKGLVVFASRDISNVVANRTKHIPASYRKHSISDAVYIGSLLNEEPKTWLKITEGNLEMGLASMPKQSPTTFIRVQNQDVEISLSNGSNIKIKDNQINIKASDITIEGNVHVVGDMQVTGSVQTTGDAVIQGISFTGHVHGNGDKGQDTTPPKG